MSKETKSFNNKILDFTKEKSHFFYFLLPLILIGGMIYIFLNFPQIQDIFINERKRVIITIMTIKALNIIIVSTTAYLLIEKIVSLIKRKRKRVILFIFIVLLIPLMSRKAVSYFESIFFSKEIAQQIHRRNIRNFYFFYIFAAITVGRFQYKRKKEEPKYFFFFLNKVNQKVSFEEIIFFMADQKYIYFQTKEDYYKVKKNLKEIIKGCPDYFVQASKKYIVNKNYVKSLFTDTSDGNKYKCIVKIEDEEEVINIGRKYLDSFKREFHNKVS